MKRKEDETEWIREMLRVLAVALNGLPHFYHIFEKSKKELIFHVNPAPKRLLYRKYIRPPIRAEPEMVFYK